MPKRLQRFWSVGLVLILGLSLWAAAVRAAETADPDVQFVQSDMMNIAPGPGWPKGWTAPATPTTLPPKAQVLFEEDRQTLGDKAPTKLELRVMPYLPDWTKEYPYSWDSEYVICGRTSYLIWYPVPDHAALEAAYGDPYTHAYVGASSKYCTFTGVTYIGPFNTTPEEKERARLSDLLQKAFDYSRLGRIDQGGLLLCPVDQIEGSPENIFVCFNNGDASQRFDVPAYLDTQVGRVRVPVRFVSEMMRGSVSWDGQTGTVTIRFPGLSVSTVRPKARPGTTPKDWIDPNEYAYNGNYELVETTVTQNERTIVLQVGKPVALIDGQEVQLDAPPVNLPPGRVMIPLRFVAEQMGAKVYWVGRDPIFRKTGSGKLSGTYQVHIFTKFYPFFEYPSWFLETRAQKV